MFFPFRIRCRIVCGAFPLRPREGGLSQIWQQVRAEKRGTGKQEGRRSNLPKREENRLFGVGMKEFITSPPFFRLGRRGIYCRENMSISDSAPQNGGWNGSSPSGIAPAHDWTWWVCLKLLGGAEMGNDGEGMNTNGIYG